MILPSKKVIDEDEIAARLVSQHKKNLLVIVNHDEKQ